MTLRMQVVPKTKRPQFATLLVMALAPEDVGKQIAAGRKAKGWTHEQFRDAVREHIDPKTNLRTVQRWQVGRDPQSGKSWLPRLHTLMEVADLLEVPRSHFVEDEHEDADEPATRAEIAALRQDLAEVQAGVSRLLAERGVQAEPVEPPKKRAATGSQPVQR